MASIPQRELMIWENPDLRDSLLRGLAEAADGQVAPRDDFLDDDEDEVNSQPASETDQR